MAPPPADTPGHAAAPDADPLLADLTEPQRQAVTHVDGPLLVLAGPGSGKTRVITRRIAHLVLRVGVAPWNLLAITFTNKAAAEMRQRVGAMLTERQASALTLSTFHSFCARVLRRHGQSIGVTPGYSIYDGADQTRAMKQALTILNISLANFPPGRVLGTISAAKNELLDAAAYEAAAADFYARQVARIFHAYQRILDQCHALDFDDLLLRTVQLVRRDPAALAALREQYRYVLVDEYQDTNHAQFVLAQAVAAEHRNLCVTGDPDQSIYRWRGADIRNILEFERHFPRATTVRLEQNYRSTKRILAVADQLIQHNCHRRHKALWTENESGVRVQVVRCRQEQQESAWVAQRLRQAHEEQGIAWREMAVFYRINALSRVVESALRDARIPYQIARGTAFFDRKEIKDAVAYLRVLANPSDEISLLRIINVPPRGISDRSIKALQDAAVGEGTSVADLLGRAAAVPGLGARADAAIERFRQQLAAWRQAIDATPALPLADFFEAVLADSGLEQHHAADAADPDSDRLANLGELVSSARQFDDAQRLERGTEALDPLVARLSGYLAQISLVSDVDGIDAEPGAVTLMTLHAAKGLEFAVVIMLGIEDGLLPHSQSQADPRALEEERRLCFVGITRARQSLALTHTCVRTVFGHPQAVLPSRFLDELPAEQIERVNLAAAEPQCEDAEPAEDIDQDTPSGSTASSPPSGSTASSPRGRSTPISRPSGSTPSSRTSGSTPSSPRSRLPHGAMVRHPQFGLGQVLRVEGSGAGARARVRFAQAGIKTLVLEHARLELVP